MEPAVSDAGGLSRSASPSVSVSGMA